jgi:hypothetical protein
MARDIIVILLAVVLSGCALKYNFDSRERELAALESIAQSLAGPTPYPDWLQKIDEAERARLYEKTKHPQGL